MLNHLYPASVYVNRFGIARDGGERIEKGGGNRRAVFGEVNVGEEVDGHERA